MSNVVHEKPQEAIATYPYAMVSLEARRDSHDPLRFFQKLSITHLYLKTWWDKPSSEKTPAIHYSNPLSLARHLHNTAFGIVQGVEPFALLPLPFIPVILQHVWRRKSPLVVVSLENIAFKSKYGTILHILATPLLWAYVRSATVLVAVNEGARQNFLHFGAKPEKIVRLMYGCWGVDVDEFSPDGPVADIPGCEGKRVILFVGRLLRLKGVFDLVEAFADIHIRFPDTRLVFVGEGEDRENVRAHVAEKGLTDAVHFYGAAPNADVSKLMRLATLLVAPSRTTQTWAEQVGMVLLQALACGVPVVSTTSGSIPEFVSAETGGLLVEEGAPAQLTNAMAALLSDPQLYQTFRERGIRSARERFDAQKNIAEVEQVILEYCTKTRALA